MEESKRIRPDDGEGFPTPPAVDHSSRVLWGSNPQPYTETLHVVLHVANAYSLLVAARPRRPECDLDYFNYIPVFV